MSTFTQKLKNGWKSFWGWITRHKIWSIVIAVVLILILVSFIRSANKPANVVTDTVARKELRRTVLATGDVTSKTDLNLSFLSSGSVQSVSVSVGDHVTKGQILATLSNGNEAGTVTQAQGALKSAQAALDKLQQGSTSEEVAVDQIALTNAQVNLQNVKSQQSTLVGNAKTAVLNAGLAIKPALGSSTTPTYIPTLSGTYIGTAEGQYLITTHGGSGAYFNYSGIESGNGAASLTTPVPLGIKGLSITFPQGFSTMNNMDWIVTIPNTESPSYLSAENAYNAALDTQNNAIATAQANIDAAQATLNLQKAAPRSADINAAEANVLSAEGKLQSAQAAYNNTIIRAPADGTITSVDIKVGELAQPQKEVLVLEDISSLYLEANINEADISSVVLAQPVEVTFDALGPNQKFTATVSHIDPAGTVVSGVVNYKIEAQIQGDTSAIKPGMTANMTVVTADKPGVLVVPTRAILDSANGKVVRVITNPKKNTFTEVPVTVGMEGDDGTEVTSGLSEGDTIVVLSNSTAATAGN